MARVERINVNPEGGVPKHRAHRAEIHEGGVRGDRQKDLRYHGGPDRAVSLFSMELIQSLAAEGHPISPGAAGENLTLSGLDWKQMQAGKRLRVGTTVELEIVSFTTPCKKIKESFKDFDFTRISEKLHPGWSRVYARVLNSGWVQEGDVVDWVEPA